MTAAPKPLMDVDSGDGLGGNGTRGDNDDLANVDFNALGDEFEIHSH